MGGSDGEDEEKEEAEAPAAVPTQKRKRAESGIVTRGKKVAKQDGEKGKKDVEKGKKDGENGKKGNVQVLEAHRIKSPPTPHPEERAKTAP
ncbi:hypothetical protein PISMIDRAFT_10296 [Pisolithus microcarpus 441]|uniref:Uncharacterized protein n=1 Tax=Pisolithus microcarpus 441 TaxID=765257 RepID=A0A0C9ZX97_9AGAM|nr:hypothetical protein BKA83DRAFT_10296 [Pisolithus microcarpus]KIK24293.1 hypothetical protein PISMIDRAFT_10296 [Pisolithus microcarpus 441]